MRHVGCTSPMSWAAWTHCTLSSCTCSLRSWQQVCWSHPIRPSWLRTRPVTSSMSWRTSGTFRTAASSRFTAKSPSMLPTPLLHTWLMETWGWAEGSWGGYEDKWGDQEKKFCLISVWCLTNGVSLCAIVLRFFVKRRGSVVVFYHMHCNCN